MFWRKKKVIEPPQTRVDSPVIDFTKAVASQQEKDEVAIISSVVLARDSLGSTVKVTSVREVDIDLEAAAVVVASVLANDRPDTAFRIKNIYEEKR